MSATVQYIIIFVILAAVIAWIIYKLVKKDKGTQGGCCGCDLAETCNKVQKNQKK